MVKETELFEFINRRKLSVVINKDKLLIFTFILIILMFKCPVCYTQIPNLSQFTINVPKIPLSTSLNFATLV